MFLMRFATMFQENNVLKFLFKIVNKFQERKVPLLQDRNVILLLISSAVLYSVL